MTAGSDLEQRLRQAEAINRLARVITSGGDGPTIRQAMVEIIGEPLDVDLHMSTSVHPTRVTCQAVQVGPHRIWTLDPLAQLQEATALLVHFAAQAYARHPGLRGLAHKRVTKSRERIAELLPLLTGPSDA